MPDLHSLPEGWWPGHAIRNNGPDALVLERMKLWEVAGGWPCYCDVCEWENFASIFHDGTHLYTTWSGKVLFMDFFAVCHGATTDITPDGLRAVTKMKATISQRFVVDGVEVDVECDCRFCYFFEKVDGRWGARFVRHWYEKDKVLPVDPAKVPKIDEARLASYPEGYKFLAYFQEETMSVSVIKNMPGHNRHKDTSSGDKHDHLYKQAKAWLEGENGDF
ncbi:hypothetical protein BDW75DRAFT_235225 [Aspergillus navahoensis]